VTIFQKLPLLLLIGALSLVSCANDQAQSPPASPSVPLHSTQLYINADIVTVDGANPNAEALAVRDGLIIAVGSRAEVEAAAGAGAQLRDMAGKTIVPGLIDAHGHISLTALTEGFAKIQPPPAGPVSTMAQLLQVMTQWHQDHPEMLWLNGWGYDDSLLAEARHPTKFDLDKISIDKPVMLIHVSSHLMSCNSKCLEMVGITAQTKNPAGGVIRRVGSSTEPNGVLEESAMYKVFSQLPPASEAQRLAFIEQAQLYYARHGITTVQDGATNAANIADLEAVAASGKLILDVVGFPVLSKGDDIAEAFSVSSDYRGRYRTGGIKLLLDGSPQGKTAWLTQPYSHPPHGQDENYKGYASLENSEANAFILQAFSRNIPVLAHANGDAAADQLLTAVTLANTALGIADRRPVMIHAQTVREDQIDSMKVQGVIPSYFSAHTFYWGDWHRDSVFGEQRANRISPLQSTVARDMVFTTHNDTPVVPPDMMRLLWASVNRVTRSGKVLGPEQRVSPLQALKSVTLNAAFQYFEEDRKGSITVGKLADLTVLSANPLRVAPMAIKDIQIEETIKEGVSIYSRR
jgi:predicted amidohydrolase YtcJ